MASQKSISFLFLFLLLLLLISGSSATLGKRTRNRYKPCKRVVVYFHEIDYNGKNGQNATAAIVGNPDWGNKTAVADPFAFGFLFAFDNPITLDNNPDSTPVGRAHGFFLYTSKTTFAAWFSVTFVFNSTEHKGSVTLEGTEYTLQKTRDIAITGGTGDFFMARGVATVSTDAIDAPRLYFRLRFDIKLYECW